MQRDAHSFFSNKLFLVFCSVFGFGEHTTSDLRPRIAVSGVEEADTLLSLFLIGLYFVLQVSQLNFILLRYFEEIVVLIGEFEVLFIKFVVVFLQPSKIGLFEGFPFVGISKHFVQPFPLLFKID